MLASLLSCVKLCVCEEMACVKCLASCVCCELDTGRSSYVAAQDGETTVGAFFSSCGASYTIRQQRRTSIAYCFASAQFVGDSAAAFWRLRRRFIWELACCISLGSGHIAHRTTTGKSSHSLKCCACAGTALNIPFFSSAGTSCGRSCKCGIMAQEGKEEE